MVDAKQITPDASTTLIKATKEQKIIGWENWIEGRWSKELAVFRIMTLKF
jgi:hypothetical protein